jgi:hypothetical protein
MALEIKRWQHDEYSCWEKPLRGIYILYESIHEIRGEEEEKEKLQ